MPNYYWLISAYELPAHAFQIQYTRYIECFGGRLTTLDNGFLAFCLETLFWNSLLSFSKTLYCRSSLPTLSTSTTCLWQVINSLTILVSLLSKATDVDFDSYLKGDNISWLACYLEVRAWVMILLTNLTVQSISSRYNKDKSKSGLACRPFRILLHSVPIWSTSAQC